MAMDIPFRRELEFEYGVMEDVSPMIRRIVARNPSAFTFHGTGTYVIGRGKVAVIDPGPDLSEHVVALLGALAGEEITHILVTHTHQDHSPACRAVQAARDVATHGYGPHGAGKWEQGINVEEGGDMNFAPDVELRHGDVVEGDGWSLECVHTPGHTSNHLCFQLREEKALLSGDHVMGWSTSIVSPPDGDMAQYMASLRLLLGRDDEIYWPTHGPAIDDPKRHVQAFIDHRLLREREILDCLSNDLRTIPRMVSVIYRDVPKHLHGAAARSVFAHLIHLAEEGRVACEGELAVDAEFRLP